MASYYLPSESKIGAGFQAHGIAQAMVRAGHTVTMFSPSTKPTGAGYEHVLVPVRKPGATFRWAAALRRQDLSGFDVFHAAMDDYLMMGRQRPAHVRTMHGSCFAEALHIRGVKERLRMFILGCSEVVATGVADRTVLVADNVRRWYPWVKTVIPNGVDLSEFHPGDHKAPAPTILFVGTYRNRKRGELLMEVFKTQIRPRVPDAQLWMVCSDAPEAEGVEVLGRLTNGELADRYRRAWAFCLPSSYEGFGVPYIEALASGTPVVASPNPGALDVLDKGSYGRIVPDGRLGEALVALLTDEAERERLATIGIVHAQQYDWDNIVAQYEELYQELLCKPRRHVPRRLTAAQFDAYE